MLPTSKLLRQLLDPRFDGYHLDIPTPPIAMYGTTNTAKIREWQADIKPVTDRRKRRKDKAARKGAGDARK